MSVEIALLRDFVIGFLLLHATSAVSQEKPAISVPDRVEVSLVLLDVVVTDKSGQPVGGLAISDFDLLVDNSRVALESVEDQCAGSPLPGSGTSGDGRGRGADDRYFILLFDMSHLTTLPRRNAIRAALTFVDEAMDERDRLMILVFRRGLHVVAGFTSDRALLRARLDTLLDDASLVDTAPFEEQVRLEQIRMNAGGLSMDSRRRSGRGTSFDSSFFSSSSRGLSFACESEARQAEIETSRALRAMANALPAFGALPGRKALILFTETLRTDPGGPYYEACGLPTLARPSLGLTVLPEIADLAMKANLARVSFYPVHAGGISSLGTGSGEHSARGLQAGLALSTGGRNSVLMKDTLQSFRQATADMSCHYVLTYRPGKELKPGRHALRITVKGKGLTARHREFFTLESPEAASESQILAALSSPGMYHELKVDAHGYSLSQIGHGRRRFLLKASVPLTQLTLLPTAAQGTNGAVRIRGGMISRNELRCEFDRTIPVAVSGPPADAPIQAGLEAFCDLDPGEYEIVVTARDEMGGALGSFWGRTEIKSSPQDAGPVALLWTRGTPDIWARVDSDPWPAMESPKQLFINRSLTLRPAEPAMLTFMACGGKANRRGEELWDIASASVHLEGPQSLDLAVGPATSNQSTVCRLLAARIPADSLTRGSYLVLPRVPQGWRPVGKAVRIEVQ